MAAESDATVTVMATSDTEALLAGPRHTGSEDGSAAGTKGGATGCLIMCNLQQMTAAESEKEYCMPYGLEGGGAVGSHDSMWMLWKTP